MTEEEMVRFTEILRRRLGRKSRYRDPHWLEEGIEDALLRHYRHPERFDATRGASLIRYLEMWARSWLYRRRRAEKRIQKHEKTAGIAEKDFEKIVTENRVKRSINIGRERTEQEIEIESEPLNALVAQQNPYDRVGVELRAGAHKL